MKIKDRQPEESPEEKAASKLQQQQSKARVLLDDISYLMGRIEQRSLASIPEHYEIQEEIHDLQRILADWDTLVAIEIAKIAATWEANKAIGNIPGMTQ